MLPKNIYSIRAFGSAAIPYQQQWVDEHYFLANFADTLAHLQENLSEDSGESGEKGESGEGILSLNAKIRDILRATFVATTAGSMSKVYCEFGKIHKYLT